MLGQPEIMTMYLNGRELPQRQSCLQHARTEHVNRAHRILEHALERPQLELWEVFPSLPDHLQSRSSCWRTNQCSHAQQQVPAAVEDGAS